MNNYTSPNTVTRPTKSVNDGDSWASPTIRNVSNNNNSKSFVFDRNKFRDTYTIHKKNYPRRHLCSVRVLLWSPMVYALLVIILTVAIAAPIMSTLPKKDNSALTTLSTTSTTTTSI